MICVDELCDLLERVRYTYSYNTDRFILYFTNNLEGWVVMLTISLFVQYKRVIFLGITEHCPSGGTTPLREGGSRND